MKQVIFNVGGALASYLEFDDRKILVDLGKSDEFNPVIDFLKPLYDKREKGQEVHTIDQLIISHPHKDHIAAVQDFEKYFTAGLITTPNDNEGMNNDEKINWELVGNKEDESIITLKRLLKGRHPPLRATNPTCQFLYYLKAKNVEDNSTLNSESYVNNISLAFFFVINGYTLFMPGDMQKEGICEILKTTSSLRRHLRELGVDVLVTPHHGLRSSFSTKLFSTMKGEKTRGVNIVSEKQNTDDAREVDTRYGSSDFCNGKNSLSERQIRTSRGHVYIDYSNSDNLQIELIDNAEALLKKFI